MSAFLSCLLSGLGFIFVLIMLPISLVQHLFGGIVGGITFLLPFFFTADRHIVS